jgi:hypothetical protein
MTAEPHITVTGPGRCTECSFHVRTQGHRDGCSTRARVYDELPDSWDRMGLAARPEHLGYGGRTPKKPKPAQPPTSVQVYAGGHNPRYVAAAITAELNKLAAAVEGKRNATLHTVSCNVFEFVKAGHADERAARDELERIAAAIGLDDSEIRATIKSAWKRTQPRTVPAPGLPAPRITEVESPQQL